MALKNNKSLGQHWLKDRAILNEIARLAVPEDTSPKTCLEIGPGLGTLTSSLLRCFEKVLAIEYDERLATNLPKSFPGKNLEVVHADFLKYDLSQLTEPYVVAGNIPYYITSPIIFKLLGAKPSPQRIVLLIQKEVADRIVAQPGDHTYLSLAVQNYATADLAFYVSREYFTPPPKVDSAVLVLTPKTPVVSSETLAFIKHSFASPRKKLAKNLPYEKDVILARFAQLGISPDARPSDLDLATWEKLRLGLAKNKQ
jgi:16S rRNA (adenine1518-N6/adenine1519-N6)-dimethyltransferase